MGRLIDWPDRLEDHVEKWRNKKFKWGIADCSMFVLEAERAICGKSRFDDFVGEYKTEKQSKEALKRFGKETLEATLDDRLEITCVTMAQRGDVALIDTPEGDGLSLVLGPNLAAMGKDGLVFLPIDSAKKVWKV